MSGANTSGQPTSVISANSQPQIYRKTFAGLAISQITMSILMVIFQAAIIPMSLITSYSNDGVVAPGIWIGVILVITGGIGFGASQRNSRKWVTAYMILNIITVSLFVSSFMIAVSIFTAIDFYYSNYSSLLVTISSLNLVNLVMAASQFFITITAAVFGCKYVCCPPTNPYQPFVIPANLNYQHNAGAFVTQTFSLPTNQGFHAQAGQGYLHSAGQGFPQLATPVYLYNAATAQPRFNPPHAPATATVSTLQKSNPPQYSELQKTN